jgi:Rps23 Pro-64 3,4-dihydroxylase Tpa1-like proline 4-hydroxylase
MTNTSITEVEPQLQELINMGILPPALLEQMGLNKPLVINTDEEDLVRKTDFSHIKHEEIKVSKDKSIHVFDGIFNYAEISGIYNALSHGTFMLDNANRPDVQAMQDRKLVYRITPDLLDKLHFFDGALDKIIDENINMEEYAHFKSYVNLGLYTDTHEVHADHYYDRAGKTLLYYVNETWNKDWGGETAFLDDNAEKIIYTSQFVPGRVVIFDSNIPHSAKPQSIDGPAYRFTMAMKFFRREEKYGK